MIGSYQQRFFFFENTICKKFVKDEMEPELKTPTTYDYSLREPRPEVNEI